MALEKPEKDESDNSVKHLHKIKHTQVTGNLFSMRHLKGVENLKQ